MSWFNKFFGAKQDDRLESLVRRLIFYQDEAIFLDALREATSLAPKGDDLGVKALSEAIRRRCRKKEITFYIPGLTIRSSEDYENASGLLLELAKSDKLLDNPEATQNIISAASTVSQDGLKGLLNCIFIYAGSEQGYDFQLLYNQMHSTIKLKEARGEPF